VAALLYLPVVLVALLFSLEIAARAGSSSALRLRRDYLDTSARVRLAALGMLISATVHLALAPVHLAEAPLLAGVFVLDGVALLIVALWALARPRPGWRAAGVGLLAGGVLAYAALLAVGLETLEAVGVATKVVEVTAICLLVLRPDQGAGRLSQFFVHLKRTGGLTR
jgi:hypothetical protein